MIPGEELPDGVGGVECRRWCWETRELFHEGTGLTAGPLMACSGHRDQLHSAPVGAPGYFIRHVIIELTSRGRQALREMRSNALHEEKRWQQVLGEQRFGELRETLVMLLSAESGA